MKDNADTRFAELLQLKRLPSPKGVAVGLVRLAQQENLSIGEVRTVVQADPALVGHLVHLANGTLLTGDRPALSIDSIIAQLGLQRVRTAALGFALQEQPWPARGQGFDFDAYWSSSLARACAAQQLASTLRLIAPGDAFVLGLLSQVGSFALACVYPEQYGRILAAHQGKVHAALLDAERREFAMDHLEITTAMLADWGFPRAFTDAFRQSRRAGGGLTFRGSRAARLAALLDVACEVADACAAPEGTRPELLARLHHHAAALAPGQQDMARLVAAVAARWRECCRTLQIGPHEAPSWAADEGTPGDPSEASAQAARPAGPLKILVVDDDATTLELLLHWLREAGHLVHGAADGDAALRAVVEIRPEVLITDWELPALGGPELCASLRATAIGRQIYVLIVSIHGSEARFRAAFQAGADDYIVKPVRRGELLARLHAARRAIDAQQAAISDSTELRGMANELVIANRRLRYLARTDELTGLPNRRHAMERLEQELSRLTRAAGPFGLVIGDIDHFKAINDNCGHQYGDLVLQAVAQALRSGIRIEDTVCRIGGEEFMVIAPGIDQKGLTRLVERLRIAVAGLVGVDGRMSRPVTMSFGCAMRSDERQDSRVLIKACDEALYAAKHEGRNRAVMA